MFDEPLAERVRAMLPSDVEETGMFGGIGFLDRGNLVCAVVGDDLVARVGPGWTDAALREPHTRPFDPSGMPLKGFVYVAADGTVEDEGLADWVGRCLAFVGGLPGK